MRPIARKNDLVVQETGKELLIYDLESNKAICLNETSTLVWRYCDGTRSISEISTAMGKELGSLVEDDLVWLALEQLQEQKLVEDSFASSAHFGEISRRDVVKKIGAASLVTLPIVASVIAPTAVHATSFCSNPGGLPTGSERFITPMNTQWLIKTALCTRLLGN